LDQIRKARDTPPEEVTYDEAVKWLKELGLHDPSLPEAKTIRRYKVFSSIVFGEEVSTELKVDFMRKLMPMEDMLAVS
jgi:hypothetical protein